MVKKTGRVVTTDPHGNFVARVGMQQLNQHAASTYRANYTSRDRLLIEWAYRSSWIIGAAVDSEMDDITKKGVRITSEIDPKRRGILESQFDELQPWDCINEMLERSRLYGGMAALILIEGQAPLMPLVLDKVGKGSLKGLAIFDRWVINPQLTRCTKTFGPNLGKPKFYDIVVTAQGLPAWTVHHSRPICMDGMKLPYQQKITKNEWSTSIVERIFNRLILYDSTSAGAAQLAYKAHLRTVKIKKLCEIITMDGKPFEVLTKQMELVHQYQANEGISPSDSEDESETHSYSFTGLPNLLSGFKEDIADAVGILPVRLFRQLPKGSSTSDADPMNYYDDVGVFQERDLRPHIRLLPDVLHRSELGEPLPQDFTFEFNLLWQMSDTDRPMVTTNTTTAFATAVCDLGMSLAAALTDLCELSDVTDTGTSISDGDVQNAAKQWRETESETSPPPPIGDPVSEEPTGDSRPDKLGRRGFLRWSAGKR